MPAQSPSGGVPRVEGQGRTGTGHSPAPLQPLWQGWACAMTSERLFLLQAEQWGPFNPNFSIEGVSFHLSNLSSNPLPHTAPACGVESCHSLSGYCSLSSRRLPVHPWFFQSPQGSPVPSVHPCRAGSSMQLPVPALFGALYAQTSFNSLGFKHMLVANPMLTFYPKLEKLGSLGKFSCCSSQLKGSL